MSRKFKNFEDALSAAPVAVPVAANDNKPAVKKKPDVRYRGGLPALRWLFDYNAELGRAVAAALPKPEAKSWVAGVTDTEHETRPTVGELLKAASDAFRAFVRDGVRQVGAGLIRVDRGADADYRCDEWVYLGTLKFNRGRLTEWGKTKKGKKLRPVDRITHGVTEKTGSRNPSRYLKTKPTTPSPLHAEPLQRPMSGEPALPPMLDPLEGVERNRAILAKAYSRGAPPVTKCPTVVARGASFIGGVSNSSGNASKGAQLWEAPERRKGEVLIVLEEVAARGTLTSIGERLGFSGGRADRAGKTALVEAARVLVAANDNAKAKKSAA